MGGQHWAVNSRSEFGLRWPCKTRMWILATASCGEKVGDLGEDPSRRATGSTPVADGNRVLRRRP